MSNSDKTDIPFPVGSTVEALITYNSVTGDSICEGMHYRVVDVDWGGWPVLDTDKVIDEGWNPRQFELVSSV